MASLTETQLRELVVQTLDHFASENCLRFENAVETSLHTIRERVQGRGFLFINFNSLSSLQQAVACESATGFQSLVDSQQLQWGYVPASHEQLSSYEDLDERLKQRIRLAPPSSRLILLCVRVQFPDGSYKAAFKLKEEHDVVEFARQLAVN